MAHTCPICKGKKSISSVNFLKARKEHKLCPGCNGAGEFQEAQTEGLRIGRVIAETFFWEDLSEGKSKAKLEIRVHPIMDKDNRPAYTPPKTFGEKPRPRLFIEIVRMNTKIHYRKQGIMHKLVAHSLMDPKMEFACCNWDECTVDARNLLLGMGFRQSGPDLVWRRNEQPSEYSGDICQGPEQPEGSKD